MSKHLGNIIVFGPAGVGKSTVIKKLALEGYKSLDLELFWNSKISLDANRSNLMKVISEFNSIGAKSWIFGAAGLDPKMKYPGFGKILLNLPQDEYESRRKARDSEKPEYGKQPKMMIESWIRLTHWDAIIKADDQASKKIAALLSKK